MQQAQALVDLLKDPLCVGEARRLVLEQLARPFADQWEFVAYAREHHLDLDRTTRPSASSPRLASRRSDPGSLLGAKIGWS